MNEVETVENTEIEVATDIVRLINKEAIIALIKTPEARQKIRVSHCNSRKELDQLGLIVTVTIPDAEGGSMKKVKGEHDEYELLTLSNERKESMSDHEIDLARKHGKNYKLTKRLLNANIASELDAICKAVEIAS